MSFEQGLSGLNTSSKSLDVIGNNISNASTVGFKGSSAQFADVYANSVYGSSGNQVGIGTQITAVSQQFTQGNITVSNNPLDVAINGDGFFTLNDNGATTYSRNGQFHLDADGYLVNSTGQQVVGNTQLSTDPVTGKVTSSNTPGPIQVSLNDLPAKSTTSVTMGLNLDATSTAVSGAFNAADPTTYSYSTPVTVYDSLGVSHTLTLYFSKQSSPDNTWQVHATVDGTSGATSISTMTFPTSGASPTGATGSLTINLANGASPLTIGIDMSNSTQFAGSSGVNLLSQDGYAKGQLVGVSIDSNGVIYGRYSNNINKPLQQLLLTNFRNPNGLIPLGNNQWASSQASGPAITNTPGSGLAGAVQSGATEDSNVDLTNSLVDLIVAQREYQANAQTIKAQDTILQTLVNLG